MFTHSRRFCDVWQKCINPGTFALIAIVVFMLGSPELNAQSPATKAETDGTISDSLQSASDQPNSQSKSRGLDFRTDAAQFQLDGSERDGDRFYRKNWAVIVGIDKYRGKDRQLKNLMNAENDAREVWQLLKEDFGYSEDRVRYLTNEGATLSALKHVFDQWLPGQEIQKDDSLIFFFAGHGLIDADNQGWLATTDSNADRIPETCLSVEWLRDQISRLPCKHKIMVLDSCYSGVLFQDTSIAVADRRNGNDQIPKPFPDARGPGTKQSEPNLEILARSSAFLGISAGRDTPVADGLKDNRHSVFTAAMLRVLRDRAYTLRPDQGSRPICEDGWPVTGC